MRRKTFFYARTGLQSIGWIVFPLLAVMRPLAKMYDSNCKKNTENNKTLAGAVVGTILTAAGTYIANKAIDKNKDIEVQAGSVKAKIGNKK